MRKLSWLIGLIVVGMMSSWATAAQVPLSSATEDCLSCHEIFHPGIVADWRASRHARVTPLQATKANDLERRMSASTVTDGLQKVVVGCAECHTLRPEAHADTFEHNDQRVHVVPSPDDCKTCHPQETAQFSVNLMAHARGNLVGNDLYRQLRYAQIGKPVWLGDNVRYLTPDPLTEEESCFYCHGTRLEVAGQQNRDTEAGELVFPIIKGWPNQGVGRINLDGSLGSCSACHTRHRFAVETARKPYTCQQCHIGPDVPAYKVYMASKHGNLFASHGDSWNWEAVPWTIGRDFQAPTCAGCHISLMVNTEGDVVAERTHQMSPRLPWRIYGLIYAHPHPQQPDTTIIRNREGLPLPTDLDGTFAAQYLIDQQEQARRTQTAQQVCLACHDRSWVDGHWTRFDNTIKTTNRSTAVATAIMQSIWQKGRAQGLSARSNPFDEYIERQWSDIWLLHANTIRFAAAMAGGGDYGVFAGGRHDLANNISHMVDWLRQQNKGPVTASP
jgi:hypothetical protein